MAFCDDKRKWLHAQLIIRSRDNSNDLFSISSLDATSALTIPDLANSDKIFVRTEDCTQFTTAPALWSVDLQDMPDESPGFFYFRPTVEDLEQSFVEVSSYEDVINEANRRVFVYNLIAVFDSNDLVNGDPICVTTGPPDSVCPGFYDVVVDDLSSIVFRWSEQAALTEIGCCDIPLDDPGNPGEPPTEIRDCSRLWFVNSSGSGSNREWFLKYYDTDPPEPGEAFISRGIIVKTAQSEDLDYFYDIAWDDRDYLWALCSFGLRRILPGRASILPETTGFAQVNSYASVEVLSGSEQWNAIFNTTTGGTGLPEVAGGKPSMSFSQDSGKMFVQAGDYLFELTYIDDNSWRVSRASGALGLAGNIDNSNSDGLGDLAFDTFNRCYCNSAGNLATIDFSDGASFGNRTIVGANNALAGVTGMDYILDLASGDFITLYGVNNSGELFEINRDTGETNTISGINIGSNVTGMSSCQAGEDLRSYESPIFPGVTPWVFVLDASGSMDNQGTGSTVRATLLVDELISYITTYVQNGERMVFWRFSDSWTSSGELTNIQDAVNWLSGPYGSNISGPTNFCEDGNTGSAGDGIYNILRNNIPFKSCIVVGDGQFNSSSVCTTVSQIEQYITDFMNFAVRGSSPLLDPSFTIRAVGINPDSGLSNLEAVGRAGGGGFESWTG